MRQKPVTRAVKAFGRKKGLHVILSVEQRVLSALTVKLPTAGIIRGANAEQTVLVSVVADRSVSAKIQSVQISAVSNITGYLPDSRS